MCGGKNGRKKYLKLKIIKPGGKVFQIPYKESAYKISKKLNEDYRGNESK